ncbi:hypothetical protein SRHO_G00128210 [Serrasalmus rhombeus]
MAQAVADVPDTSLLLEQSTGPGGIANLEDEMLEEPDMDPLLLQPFIHSFNQTEDVEKTSEMFTSCFIQVRVSSHWGASPSQVSQRDAEAAVWARAGVAAVRMAVALAPTEREACWLGFGILLRSFLEQHPEIPRLYPHPPSRASVRQASQNMPFNLMN